MDSPGFSAWKKRRAERAATSPADDAFYEAWVDAATGTSAELRAGVAHEQVDGGAVVPDHISNDEIYAGFTDMLDGSAARRRAEEQVRQDFQDRRQEQRRHAAEMGTPLRPQFED